MKNKKMTYLLGVVVLVVWGLVIFRIFEAAGAGDDDSLPIATKTIVKEPYDDYAVPKDTTRLLLNYRDPFGLVKQKDTVVVVSKKIHMIIPAIKPQIDWSFIKYAGYIKNPGSKKLIAMLSINGKNVDMTEGETADNVKLIRNMGDSVKVAFNGKTKFIVINKGKI